MMQDRIHARLVWHIARHAQQQPRALNAPQDIPKLTPNV